MSTQKSTNGRSTFVEPRHLAVRRAFGVLERLAPPLGAVWAEKLWFTVPAVPEHARQARVDLPAGESFAVELDGRAIRGTVWGTGPAVYLVHGWGGWGLQLAAYVPSLVAAGFRVITYDSLSHGYSDPGKDGPRTSALPEIAESLQTVVGRFGAPHAVIAHSVGAAAVAHAMRDDLEPGRLVFVAAVNDFRDSVDLFGQIVGFGPRIEKRMLRRFVRRIGVPIETFDVDGIGADLLAERGTLPPLLAIHDRGDRETPYQGSVSITEGWPDGILLPTSGLGHRRVLWQPALVAEVTAFVSAGAATVDGLGDDREVRRDRMAG